jgi:hypothetical protein
VSAPLVVNTMDGTVWTRRGALRDGEALYAMAEVRDCPELVMSTLAELAEHVIVGSADVLPVPVGPKPQESAMDADHAKAPWGRGEDGRPLLPMGAHWTDVPELVERNLAEIQDRVDQAQSGRWYVSPTAGASGTVCTQYDGYARTVGRFTSMLPADLGLVLHAHSDLRWCLDVIAKLRSRVAELEAERHTTNEALDDAVKALRAAEGRSVDEDPIAYTLTDAPTVSGACKACGSAPDSWCPDCGACQKGCYDGHVDNPCTHANASWKAAEAGGAS